MPVSFDRVVLGVASTAAGGFLGVLIAWLGSHIANWNAAVLVIGPLGVAVGLTELFGGKPPLLQLNRETPRVFWSGMPMVWATGTGLLIGTGLFTRIGYSVFYVAPLGVAISGDGRVGLMVLGAYGAVRGFAPLALHQTLARTGFRSMMITLIRRRRHARALSGLLATTWFGLLMLGALLVGL